MYRFTTTSRHHNVVQEESELRLGRLLVTRTYYSKYVLTIDGSTSYIHTPPLFKQTVLA
jgi:hypothetical protein